MEYFDSDSSAEQKMQFEDQQDHHTNASQRCVVFAVLAIEVAGEPGW